MPRIEKLVPVDGKLGVVLDMPLDQFGTGSVSIYTEAEVAALLEATRKEERRDISDRISKRISRHGLCPSCIGWACAKEIGATIRGDEQL